MKRVALVIGALFAGPAIGSELIYQPINPNFGGNPLNGTFLLNQAEAQNNYKDPDAVNLLDLNQDPLERFTESLNRQILALIARRVVEEAFGDGDGALGEGGTFVSEGFEISVLTDNPDSLVLNITDTTTGDETVLEIPRF